MRISTPPGSTSLRLRQKRSGPLVPGFYYSRWWLAQTSLPFPSPVAKGATRSAYPKLCEHCLAQAFIYSHPSPSAPQRPFSQPSTLDDPSPMHFCCLFHLPRPGRDKISIPCCPDISFPLLQGLWSLWLAQEAEVSSISC